MSKNKKKCALCNVDITHKSYAMIPLNGHGVRICMECDKARTNEKISVLRGVNRMRVDITKRN